MLAGALSAALAAVEGGNLRNRDWYLTDAERNRTRNVGVAADQPSRSTPYEGDRHAYSALVAGRSVQPDHYPDAARRYLTLTIKSPPVETPAFSCDVCSITLPRSSRSASA